MRAQSSQKRRDNSVKFYVLLNSRLWDSTKDEWDGVGMLRHVYNYTFRLTFCAPVLPTLATSR